VVVQTGGQLVNFLNHKKVTKVMVQTGDGGRNELSLGQGGGRSSYTYEVIEV
jgi:hypothetical protein